MIDMKINEMHVESDIEGTTIVLLTEYTFLTYYFWKSTIGKDGVTLEDFLELLKGATLEVQNELMETPNALVKTVGGLQ